MFRFGDPGGRMYNTMGTSNVNFLALWSSLNIGGGGVAISLTSGGGRNGGNCIATTFVTNNGVSFQANPQGTAQAIWGVSLAFKVTALPAAGSNSIVIATLVDSSSAQVTCVLLPSGGFQVFRGNASGTSLGTTSTGIITANVWNHIELLTTINNSTGAVTLWLNGTSQLALTGQNTRSTANSTASGVLIGGVGIGSPGSLTISYDDIIIYDGQANDVNGNPDIHSQIGNCQLVWLLPTGAGSSSQFTPLSGSNYSEVNAATPPGDTSYVYDSNIGDIDTYAMAQLAGTVTTVKSVASLIHARSDSGSRGIEAVLYSGGGNTSHSGPSALSTSYQYWFSGWGQNPNNGSPESWTPAGVNALNAGQTVSS